MPSKAFLRVGFAAAFVVFTSSVFAAPLRVTGTIRGEAGAISTAQNIQVELFPAYESYADGLRRVTEKQAPAPLATARVGAGGTYEVLAPGKGCFRVVVRAEGHLPVEIPFLPLVDHQELPTAPLVRSLPLEVRTVGPDGRPLAGIEVRVPPSFRVFRATRMELSPSWQVAELRAVSDGKGRASIPWNHFEGFPEVVSLSPRLLGQSAAAVSADTASLRLSPTRPVRIEVRDAGDQPVPQALVRWGGLPIVVTGPDGRLEIAVPKDGPPLTVESREGEQARIAVPASAESEVVPIRLAPPRRVSGQVVDATTRKPAPGALVWNGRPLTAPPVLAGKDGTFEIDLPSWAAETLEGTAPAYDFGETRIAGQTTPERVLLPLPPAVYILGEVVDSAGRPLPGTLIVANPPRIRNGVSEPISARTSEKGRFVLRGLLPDATYWLTFTRRGYSHMTVKAKTYPTGNVRAVRFVLSEGPLAAGRLVDEGSRPVAGAEVVLSLQPGDPSFDERAQWKAVSDPEGKFSFGRVSGGSFSLKAVHPDHADLYRPDLWINGDKPETDLGTFTLAAGGTLEGKVTGADGKPIEGAQVQIQRYDSNQVPKVDVRTGPDGVFRARGLRPGQRYAVTAWQQGYVPGSQGSVQLPQEAPVRIELKPVRGLSGRVVGPEGEPVAGAEVLGRPDLTLRMTLGDVQGVTDAEGRFRLEGLPPGSVALNVSADGYMQGPNRSFQQPEGRDLESVTVVLDRARTVEARVLDAHGDPVAGATVNASSESFVSEPCVTDFQGRCRLQAKPGVACRVTAEREAFSATSWPEAGFSAVELPPGTGETQVELYLPGVVEVAGRVLGVDGRGVPGVRVHMQSVPGQDSAIWTDADGSFLIPRVPDGKYRLTAWRNQDSAQAEITVEGQPVRGLELRLGPEETEATLSGRLLGVAPVDLPQASIRAEDSRSALYASIDAGGTYRIWRLYPGEWTVKAEAPNGQVETRLHISPGQTEATLDLEIQRYRVVSGRVLLGGEPLADVELEISNGKDRWYASAVSGGTFHHRFIDSSGTGLYTIKARKDGKTLAVTSVRIPEGSGAPVEIVLERAP